MWQSARFVKESFVGWQIVNWANFGAWNLLLRHCTLMNLWTCKQKESDPWTEVTDRGTIDRAAFPRSRAKWRFQSRIERGRGNLSVAYEKRGFDAASHGYEVR